MLRITVQDQSNEIRLRLEGDLSALWVNELEDSWRAASLTLAGRTMCVDLTGVEHVDVSGQYLLALLNLRGAALLATGTEMTDLLRTITTNWPPGPW